MTNNSLMTTPLQRARSNYSASQRMLHAGRANIGAAPTNHPTLDHTETI